MPVYNKAKKKLLDNDIDFCADTIKVALCYSSYIPNIDTDEFWAIADDYEISGTGYSAGGATLANKTSIVETGKDMAYFDADDVTWSSATFSARYAVLYKSTGSAATSSLIAYYDFGSDKSVSGINFAIYWHTDGVVNLY